MQLQGSIHPQVMDIAFNFLGVLVGSLLTVGKIVKIFFGFVRLNPRRSGSFACYPGTQFDLPIHQCRSISIINGHQQFTFQTVCAVLRSAAVYVLFPDEAQRSCTVHIPQH